MLKVEITSDAASGSIAADDKKLPEVCFDDVQYAYFCDSN